MALAETAELVARLSLDDRQFTQKLNRAGGSMSKLAGKASKVGSAVAKGLAAGAAIGAGIIAANVKSGVQSLATLESAITSVDGAIETMGKTGQVTGKQIADWANEIEASVQAAFDDKDITAATTTLLRFGKVTTRNLRPAMVVMTDLAAKTGSVESAASLLAKAMADPAKAAGRLTRAGVILTKQQQKEIAGYIKSGKRAKAQALLLQIITKQTKGAAAAMAGPWQDAMNETNDVIEDAQRALAVGFLPVIKRASQVLRGFLADPRNLANIESLGRKLAGALDEALTFAQKIPWGAIGNGLKTAADWAGKLFDAFRSLPPEAQATIIALAGLNKLSGGAISDIVGELGKGLIKGVLGMTAGVVNIKAAVVNNGNPTPDTPGGKPTPGTPGKPGGLKPTAPRSGPRGNLPGVAAVAAAVAVAVKGDTPNDKAAQGIQMQRIVESLQRAVAEGRGGEAAPGGKETNAQMLARLTTIEKNTARGVNDSRDHAERVRAAIEKTAGDTRAEQLATTRAVDQVKQRQAEALVAFRSGERAAQAGNRLVSQGNAKLAAIAAKRTTFTSHTTVNVSQSVSVAAVTQHSRYRQRVARSNSLVAS